MLVPFFLQSYYLVHKLHNLISFHKQKSSIPMKLPFPYSPMIFTPHTYYLVLIRVVKNKKIQEKFSCFAIFLFVDDGSRLLRHYASQNLLLWLVHLKFIDLHNASVGANPHSRMKRLLNWWIRTFLRFSCSSWLLWASTKWYVCGVNIIGLYGNGNFIGIEDFCLWKEIKLWGDVWLRTWWVCSLCFA